MRWLQLAEVLELHRRLIDQSGGMAGIRDLGLLEASLAQPRQTFGGIDLYPELIEKAAALGFSLIQNHPFVDGNKRIGHAAMEITLVLNGVELVASVDSAEAVVLAVAMGERNREAFPAPAPDQGAPLGSWAPFRPRPARGEAASPQPANPALEDIVETLNLGHGHIGGGPDPKATPKAAVWAIVQDDDTVVFGPS